MSPLNAIPSYSAGFTQPIAPLPNNDVSDIPSQLPSATSVGASDFSSMLGKFVSEVNTQQLNASQQVGALQSGANVPLHQAVISMEEASVSFQMMVEVRNRLLESYQEIMRMQV
ncbi:MAG TPA: flagellar hook-basal body complex protein FliE [Candidatus Sulfotelmatobacter sp.]|jgi:flagellar hook-basal body complex protein FliE|nr:flagellar hook-basal body complex protein FliE [Candidatus Sulfotelmatobacter sp.]